MRLIVADAAGSGQLRDKDGALHDLSADAWSECDVRDAIITGDGQQATVRYRDDGRTVDVPANTTYEIEYHSDNVIDLRAVHPAVDSLVAAMDGLGTDEDAIYRTLDTVAGNAEAIQAVQEEFQHRTGRTLVDALTDELSGTELDRALAYLR